MLAGDRLALAGLLLAALAGAAVAGPAAEMSSSVIVFYNSDFRPIYFPTSLCSLLLNRIKKLSGSRSVNIVPTAYWYDTRNEKLQEGVCDPDRWAKTDQRVDYYCMKDVWDSPCLPFNTDTIRQFKEGIKGCLKEAFELFDEVLISPHLDDGLKRGHWRNLLHYDPLKKDRYGNRWEMAKTRAGPADALRACIARWAWGGGRCSSGAAPHECCIGFSACTIS
jgi:hypothetical protein